MREFAEVEKVERRVIQDLNFKLTGQHLERSWMTS